MKKAEVKIDDQAGLVGNCTLGRLLTMGKFTDIDDDWLFFRSLASVPLIGTIHIIGVERVFLFWILGGKRNDTLLAIAKEEERPPARTRL
jgi:hypothetical protein